MNNESICASVKRRLENIHIGCFTGMDKPLLLISTTYPGVWLEHVYDAVFYALQDASKLYLAENTIELFLSHQKPNGQLPYNVLDKKRVACEGNAVGYSQIQECVSFASLCWLVYGMNGSRAFLEKTYKACVEWVRWLKTYRMTTNRGLVEAFVGFDTGHDNSGRLSGFSHKGLYVVDGVRQNASVLPVGDEVAPVVAVDMNCNFYATLTALSKMSEALELADEAKDWAKQAAEVKKKLFEVCFNEKDCFFYDVDKNGKQRKYLSSTVFHLFMEGVLDAKEDAALIEELYQRHISNPAEFATPYPYPSMAISDSSCENRCDRNCWGYYSQGLIALRATLWMEKYGFHREFERLCAKWVEAWTKHYNRIKMGQELDPLTGVPTAASEWYSSTMLFYLYASGKTNGKNYF